MRTGSYLRRLRSSLLSRYLLIIVIALLFIPVVIPMTFIGYSIFSAQTREDSPKEYAPYTSIAKLETRWHQEALNLLGQPPESINERIRQLSDEYALAGMFWVDGQGKTQLNLAPADSELRKQVHAEAVPEQWSAAEAVAFMKKSAALEPLAIVAFIGDREHAGEGFMVMQIPDALRDEQSFDGLGSWYLVVLILIFAGFIVVSLLFFIGVRNRLLRLQTAMSFTGGGGVPEPVTPGGRSDEIGRLEEAFNTMVSELTASRAREAEEEGLRKRLVSDLSHDLRTPLTVIRTHLHVLGKESLSPRGQESLVLMDQRIENLSGLIENLLSFNLLSSGRITLQLERRDVLRVLRESAAAWYPLWEKEGFTIGIDLEGEALYWNIDESWFRRILDNLFQNILRHARSGLYVGIGLKVQGSQRVIVISDHGGGMDSRSDSKGAGLGLSIVDLLLKQMELEWKVESSGEGTHILISRRASSDNLNKI